LAFCGALVLVPLLQLVPLPPQVWTALPLRSLAVQSLTLAGQDVGWRPLSLTPHATWLSLASLIPPIAVFLAVLGLSWRDRRRVVLGLLGLGLVAGFVGMLQVALGPGGPSIGFGLGSPGEATGFFANRNHFAALLYCLLLMAAAFAINSAKALPAGSIKSWDSRTLVAVVISFAVLVALLAAQMMARSRAGIGLSIVALLGIAALATSDERQTSGLGVKRLVGGALALVLLFASQFALYRVMERFGADPLADARLTFARNTWDAAWTLMPFGSGLGSFVPVYQFFEKPQDALRDVFANRAHNDVLEVWLETGMVGLVMMALFAAWLIVSFWQVWRPSVAQATDRAISPLDLLLMRAASLVIVLLIAHSLVDYPLRTTALSVLFALSCGLLFSPRTTDPRASRRNHEASDDRDVRPTQITRPTERPVSERVLDQDTKPHRVVDETNPRQTWAWPTSSTVPSTREPNPQGTATTEQSSQDNASANTSTPSQRWGVGVEWPPAWRADNKGQKPKGSE
jgi:O-antigen ligase